MVRVTFPDALQRHLPCPPMDLQGATVGEVLAAAFDRHPALRGYLVDDRGALRPHVTVFVGGVQVRDRAGLTDPVPDGTEVNVLQALSGG